MLFTQALRTGLTKEYIMNFRDIIYGYYHKYKREFSWRQTTDPYHILVSEVMLQQTQTYRVSGKFEHFLAQFPNFYVLAQADMRSVLAAWQGLGYNRRALALQAIAQSIVAEHGGQLPADPQTLTTFRGIGSNTAGSICAFAFNQPTVFLETNIRAVLIHFFFQGESHIHDKMLLPLAHMVLDVNNPRDWYYALMDYGVALKKCYPNPSRASAHHVRQSAFQGSDRQIRGEILRMLLAEPSLSISCVALRLTVDAERVERIAQQLTHDGFLNFVDQQISLIE
ncbi:A/G-specific adenine glycosylase [Candidatus Dependentiae bacterium]|nr:A/G-specific adenine glycosylase [Candidatus Dependentiae bacterium]